MDAKTAKPCVYCEDPAWYHDVRKQPVCSRCLTLRAWVYARPTIAAKMLEDFNAGKPE